MIELKGKSVMITGGAGFIGSHLVDRLILEQPSNLVVVDNLFLGKESNLDKAKQDYPELKIYHQDATDCKAMEKIIKNEGIQVVFNLAVVPLPISLSHPKWSFNQNVDITLCLCELARTGLYNTLIHFSSSEAYGTCQYSPMDESHPLNPTTPYAASKAACDMLVLSYIHTFGIDASIVRPFNQYGPRQNDGNYAGVIPLTIKRIMLGAAPVVYGDGEQVRDFLYVRDTVDATVKIYRYPETRGRIVNIGSGKEVSINTIVERIVLYMDCDKPVLYQEVARPGDVRRHIAGIELAGELIGFEPTVDLEEGLRITIDWYKAIYCRRPIGLPKMP